MNNLEVVQCFESPNCLDEQMPDLFFCVFALVLLVGFDGLEQVTAVTDFHDDAQVACLWAEERLFVTDHIWVLDGGQNSYFI